MKATMKGLRAEAGTGTLRELDRVLRRVRINQEKGNYRRYRKMTRIAAHLVGQGSN